MAITERHKALVTYGISGQTLYRHRDLWHPQNLQEEAGGDFQGDAGQDCPWGASCPNNHTNLLGEIGCNSLPGEDLSDLDRVSSLEVGCNSLPGEDLSPSEPRSMTTEEGLAYIKQVLEQIKARSQAEKAKKNDKMAGQSQLVFPIWDEN